MEELAEAEIVLEEQAARVEQAEQAAQHQNDLLPGLEQAWRAAQARRLVGTTGRYPAR